MKIEAERLRAANDPAYTIILRRVTSGEIDRLLRAFDTNSALDSFAEDLRSALDAADAQTEKTP